MANSKNKTAKKETCAKKASKSSGATKPSARARKGASRGGAFGRGPNPERVKAILRGLDEAYPAASCALKHDNPFQLLISTILSAPSTDVRVNMATPGLFKKYPPPAALAYANPKDIEEEIRSTGFYRNKTKSILGASKKIVEEFGGEVPRTMEQILELPGVARKTANVVLGTGFGIASGVVVDTHVQRLAGRLDLTKNTDPKKIETGLMKSIPKEKWILLSHQLIWHGRQVCQARKPRCIECNLESIC